MEKDDVVYLYNGMPHSHKKEWNTTICSNLDGLGNCHIKWSKSDLERQISYNIAYMWTLKIDTSEHKLQNRNRLTNMGNKHMVTKGKRGRDKLGV